jgi:hypothetical protein
MKLGLLALTIWLGISGTALYAYVGTLLETALAGSGLK